MSEGISTLSEAVSRAVLVSVPQAILVVDRAGCIVLANAQTEDLFAYGLDELLSKSIEELLPEVFSEEPARQVLTSPGTAELRPGPVSMELRGICKDRTDLHLEIKLIPIETADGPMVCCVIRKDVRREQAEEDVRNIEERFRLMVENSHDIMTVRDADGKVRYTSPSISRIMGYTQEQMVGSTGFELIHPDERSTVENALREFWKKPGARGTMQFRAMHATGSWVSLEVVAYNLLDHPGVRGVVINGRDISERRRSDVDDERGMINTISASASKTDTMVNLLSICAGCKKIRDEQGEWEQIEAHVRDRYQVEFSHCMCPECFGLWYPEHNRK